MTVVLARPKLILEIEGHGRFQITRFNSTFFTSSTSRKSDFKYHIFHCN